MTQAELQKIERLQEALRGFMEREEAPDGPSRLQRQVKDLVQALYFRLDQLKTATSSERKPPDSPKERLTDALRRALAGLAAVPEGVELITDEMAKDFEKVLNLFDLSKVARILGETEAIKFKRRG